MAKWFIQSDEQVEGPFGTEEIQGRLGAGLLQSSHLIWGPGLDQWHTMQWWVEELPNLKVNSSGHMERWHYLHEGQSHGPFGREQLIERLKLVGDLSKTSIWTEGMVEWAPLFEFHDLLSEIGVNKREFPRAELSGRVVLKAGDQAVVTALLTISEGGFGVTADVGLTAGQTFSVELHSPALRDVIHAKAECRYVARGVAGMRFSHISVENKGALIQYVRQQYDAKFIIKAA